MANESPPGSMLNAAVPLSGRLCATILQLITMCVLAFCITRRTQWVADWRQLPIAQWLIILIYVDSAVFVFATSIVLHGIGVNAGEMVCEASIFLCLLLYMSTKILTYYFLVERAYIVGGSRKPRHKTKLWLFNCCFMLLPYTIVGVINFIFRISYVNDKGVCIIGMQKVSMMPLIIFEAVVNIYLTLLFIIPLRGLVSYQTNSNPRIRRMAWRSFIGSLATLTVAVVNLTVLMVLDGEPAWVCFTCCNADILFCTSVLHWVTSKERQDEDSLARSNGYTAGKTGGNGGNPNGYGNGTLRSHISRRVSISDVDREMDKKNGLSTTSTVSPEKGISNPLQRPAVITTECKSATPVAGAFSKYRRGSEWDEEPLKGRKEDEVELRNIHVHTVQTREVEIDGEHERSMSHSAGASTDGETDAWSRRGVVVERMV
ncbi:hypothetical protein HBI56_188250 [Parastagonospora nodorum]|uniref:Uncharacterized protein n=1 Tax=Phaeosphaeria nodorum (strain SN15 / ATCC MYA-4574 / FGSC 10173) TaxID=321614 RepID=A0A7U2F9N3_PHANO|nr:hypothetical protein HBH56_146230 [Parastagonospora nodorum]QRD01275.1 hypothetical protein JI435_119540 [Parastagonospora nodorum SN15]KAH3927782.1 hypothetical protein HBH54_151420 [Parastagonospora nodorum]KAH3947921.1 hypothetical protein HBH53_111440 [Parastagonospora nodorum]KAH3960134.1 hypothetical protein HBH51_195280 [Parastagonospora nodorum]